MVMRKAANKLCAWVKAQQLLLEHISEAAPNGCGYTGNVYDCKTFVGALTLASGIEGS